VVSLVADRVSGTSVFGDAKMGTVLPDHLTQRCHILVTGKDSFRFKAGSAAAAGKRGRQTRPLPLQEPTSIPTGGSRLDEKTGSVLRGNQRAVACPG
jgi:hypothetical protein